MKKYFILLGCVFFMAHSGKGCDVCGCGTMFLPGGTQFRAKQNMFSLSGEHAIFNSTHAPSILKSKEGQVLESTEYFSKIRFSGQWAVYKSLHLNWNIPWQAVTKSGAEQSNIQGIGDITIGINGPLYQDSLGKAYTILSGYASVELPSGHYSESLVDETVSRYMLPGSGSVDANFNLAYTYLRKQWSAFVQSSYRLNGKSRDGIAWGDSYSFFGELWHFTKLKNARKIGFKASAVWEERGKDKEFDLLVPYTGYQVFQGGIGASYFFKSVSIDFSFYRPLYQKYAQNRVNNTANFQVKFQWYL